MNYFYNNYIYDAFFLLPGIATLIFNKPSCIWLHSHLLVLVYLYIYSFKILQILLCEKNQYLEKCVCRRVCGRWG